VLPLILTSLSNSEDSTARLMAEGVVWLKNPKHISFARIDLTPEDQLWI
jgi:hypothetical protein